MGMNLKTSPIDIDVEMLKEDYEKLLATFKETDKYIIQSIYHEIYYIDLWIDNVELKA